MIKVYKTYTPSLLYQSLVWTFCQKEEEVVFFTVFKVTLGPVQTPNFSWAEHNSNEGGPKFRPDELIQMPFLITDELSSKGEKCSFRSNCLQNAL